MMRYLLLILLLCVVGLSLGFVRVVSQAGRRWSESRSGRLDYSLGDIFAIYDRQEELEAIGQVAEVFHQRLETRQDELWKGKVSLAAATDSLYEALQDYSEFQNVLQPLHPGATEREKLALIFLDHMTGNLAAGLVPAERKTVLEGLHCEFASWPTVSPAALEHLDSLSGR